MNKVKIALNKILNSIWFVVIICILIFLKTILFYNNTIAISEELRSETIIGTIWFVAIFLCFLSLLPNKARIITSIAFNIIISILLFCDNAYYTYSSNVLSIAQITNLQYGEEILSTLPMLLKLNNILYFIDIIIIIVLILTKVLKIERKEEKSKKQIIAKSILGIIGIVVFCKIGTKYIEKSKENPYNKNIQISDSTIFGYHIYDIENAVTIKSKTKYKTYDEMIKDYNDLKNDYNTKYGEEKYPFKGILEQKNIIILQLESIQEFVINKQINGKQITPNLNKFINENIEIQNMHMQSYSSTADSEHSTITSIYPMENGMSYSKYFTNDYDDLFKIFKENNYYTSYMHGNYPYFWNRGSVYGRMKVDNLVLMDEFQDQTEKINGYLSDELLYKQAVQKMKNYKTPFITFIVSASSHTGFNLDGLQDRNKINIDVGKYKDTFFGNYLEAVNYADYAFGIFIENLKKEGLYDNTAILIFGDHNGMNMYNEEMIDFLSYMDNDLTDVDLKLNYTKVACGLKLPGIQNLKIEKPVSKLDIKPTLAYLCNIEDGFSLGTNIFQSKDFVCLNNQRIITSRYYYDDNWYDIKTGSRINLETVDEYTKRLLEEYYNYMQTELEISNSISVNNLLKK